MDPAMNKLLIEAVKLSSESKTPAKEVKPMSTEDRAFLEAALKSISVDEIAEMKKCIAMLTDSSSTTSVRLQALEGLQYFCESLDNAADLHTIGGMLPVANCLSDTNDEIRAMAAFVLGTSCQNHQKVQSQLLQFDLLPRLLQLTHDSSHNVQQKALFAVSCLVREHDQAMKVFIESDGFNKLASLLLMPDIRIPRRAVFLLDRLATPPNSCREQMIAPTTSVINNIIQMMLNSLDVEACERALTLLRTLLHEEDSRATMISALKEANFVGTIQQIRSLIPSAEAADWSEVLAQANEIEAII